MPGLVTKKHSSMVKCGMWRLAVYQYSQCIPYRQQTEHLLGTTDNWEESISGIVSKSEAYFKKPMRNNEDALHIYTLDFSPIEHLLSSMKATMNAKK